MSDVSAALDLKEAKLNDEEEYKLPDEVNDDKLPNKVKEDITTDEPPRKAVTARSDPYL